MEKRLKRLRRDQAAEYEVLVKQGLPQLRQILGDNFKNDTDINVMVDMLTLLQSTKRCLEELISQHEHVLDKLTFKSEGNLLLAYWCSLIALYEQRKFISRSQRYHGPLIMMVYRRLNSDKLRSFALQYGSAIHDGLGRTVRRYGKIPKQTGPSEVKKPRQLPLDS